MSRPKPRYQPGDRIGGRYQVHKALIGGMGEVYLCLDLEQNYPYALKTFQRPFQSTALRKAFEQEVATWVALEKHPNIVRCFYMDILDNQPFMVLEWITGEEGKGADLRGWLRHGPLDLKPALEITIDVVRGLIHAQDKQPGLVHRDLKPENILVAQGGLAKITDFGLAQIVESVGLEVGTTYQALQRYKEALVDYGRAIELDSAYATAYVHRGSTYATLQQYEEALADYGRAIELDPTLAKAFFNRGNTFDKLQRYEAALADYGRAIELDPTYAAAYANRGSTYATLQQYEEALADYGRAIDLDPTLAQAFFNMGALLANIGQRRESLPYFEQAAQLGLPQAHHTIDQIRKTVDESDVLKANPAQAAFEAFQQVTSPAAMRQAVTRFPFMVQPDFITAIEQFIAQQVPAEHRPYFEQRLAWLRQIIGEQETEA